jgi:hypothetical protein
MGFSKAFFSGLYPEVKCRTGILTKTPSILKILISLTDLYLTSNRIDWKFQTVRKFLIFTTKFDFYNKFVIG